MLTLGRPGALVVSLLALSVGTAAGGEYRDPKGFSFSYPGGWYVVSSAKQLMEEGPLPPEVKAWVQRSNVDFNSVSVAVVRGGQADFADNLNVVVSNGELPATERSVKALQTELPAQYAAVGAKLGPVTARLGSPGNADAITVEYEATFPGIGAPLRQRQVYFAGGGKTFIFTCTAPSVSFAQSAPEFDRMLKSVRVPTHVARRFHWNQVVVGGLIGGIAGAIITAIKRKTRPQKPAPDHLAG